MFCKVGDDDDDLMVIEPEPITAVEENVQIAYGTKRRIIEEKEETEEIPVKKRKIVADVDLDPESDSDVECLDPKITEVIDID